ncbi:hypothetical protein JMJ35_010062 [Cladonia borealis]|uniref:Heterokaryon incompatibility domain-containing protein n=1 Tax=Cladonia borealis TaxID=184061 RepID=A0AA39V1N2_9LECA|nr:hypothetical protein JMJ35_010062 [Cladonia borealis]
MSYQYNNIIPTEHEIRVVEILPELPNGFISCQLRHTALKSDYTCLSYTWGSSQKPHQILINGRAFFVGTNLHHFLHVANRTRSRIAIWIDAICINQDDLRERNHQVEMMGQIYRGAKQVLVWLGSGSGKCEDLLHLIGQEDALISGCLPCSKARLKIDGLQSHDTDRTEHFFKALNDICSLAYWVRTWTIQEFLVAQDIKLMYGSAEADIRLFESFLTEWTKSGYGHPSQHMKAIESSVRVKVYCEERLRFQQSRHARVSLSSLLYSFYDSQCADQQDRIYAMLSLAKRGEAFQIDYREPSIELLFRTLCFCKPKTLQELARLSRLLMSILILGPAEQRLVQDFITQAQRSNMSVFHLPTLALEVCCLCRDEVTQEVHTTTLMLGCPEDYDHNPDVQHLFDFVTQGHSSGRQSTYYLVFIEWLSMSLALICTPQESNDEQCSVVGIAVQYPGQLIDCVYILMHSEELTGIAIRRQNLDDVNGIALGYDQMLCALYYMQYQRDVLNEEHEMSDIYFGESQEVVFKSLCNNADDDDLELDYSEDSELQESESEVGEGESSHQYQKGLLHLTTMTSEQLETLPTPQQK